MKYALALMLLVVTVLPAEAARGGRGGGRTVVKQRTVVRGGGGFGGSRFNGASFSRVNVNVGSAFGFNTFGGFVQAPPVIVQQAPVLVQPQPEVILAPSFGFSAVGGCPGCGGGVSSFSSSSFRFRGGF